MIKEITVPEVGEKIESGVVVAVLVSPGDTVEVEQGIVEFETEKAVVEIPSPEKGVIKEILVKEGDEVKIGAVIAKLDTAATEAAAAQEPVSEEEPSEEPAPAADPAPVKTTPEKAPAEKETQAPPQPVRESAEEPVATDAAPASTGELAPASPSVRRLARELGANIAEVSGTGPGGRISMDDVKNYVKQVMSSPQRVPVSTAGGAAPPMPDFSQWGEIEKKPLPRIRQIIANGTSTSWTTIPHVTQFDRADITQLETFRRLHGKPVEAAGGKLTVTVILLKVLVQVLKEYPQFNASIDTQQGEIIYKKFYNFGIATDTDRGLMMPVLRDVDKKSLTELAVGLKTIAERTRNKKITPDELDGGSFSISNQGSIGGTDFTPIIYWPQVAILGVSRGSVQPVYDNGVLVPRMILPLSLSYDHRMIDGADAARFLKRVVELLEAPLALYLDK